MKGVIILIRGASQQFKFTTPYLVSALDEITVIFKQYEDGQETVSIKKTRSDCRFIGPETRTKTIYVILNQDETLRFSTDSKAYVQLRAITSDGLVFASRIKPVTVHSTLDETILVQAGDS